MGRVRGIIFDMDGTLIVQELDFAAMRREIGLPPDTPLLEALTAMSEAERAAANEVLLRHERIAARTARVNPGVVAFLDCLDRLAVRRGLFSRNSREAVESVLNRCALRFDAVVARENAPFKPNPEGLWQICEAWQLAPAEVLMVGDYLYDIQAGRNAGMRTALVTHGRKWFFAGQADLVFPSFEEIPDVLRGWIAAGG